MKALLALFLFALATSMSFSAQAMTVTTSQPPSMEYCADRFTGRGSAHGYGSYENCKRAQESAESSALFSCYAAGHSDCEVLATKQLGYSPNRCDYEALVRAKPQSLCSPENTFTTSAWAEHFGSEHANCQRAFKFAEENAIYTCYNSGFNSCETLYKHVLRVHGQSFCEVQVVIKGQP